MYWSPPPPPPFYSSFTYLSLQSIKHKQKYFKFSAARPFTSKPWGAVSSVGLPIKFGDINFTALIYKYPHKKTWLQREKKSNGRNIVIKTHSRFAATILNYSNFRPHPITYHIIKVPIKAIKIISTSTL